MQGAQILRNEAYIEVRCNDEGCSATQQMDFLRSRQSLMENALIPSIQCLQSDPFGVPRSEGSRDEGRGKRQEQGVGSRHGKGKVCFGFFLPDDPCPADYAQGHGCSLMKNIIGLSPSQPFPPRIVEYFRWR